MCFPENSHIPHCVGTSQADLQAVPFTQAPLRSQPAPPPQFSVLFLFGFFVWLVWGLFIYFASVWFLFVCLFSQHEASWLISILAPNKLTLELSPAA